MTVAAGRGGAHGYWRVRGIATAILCITCVGVSVGLLTPLIAVKLEQQSGSGLIIGANALMAALSTVIAAPFVPGLLARYEPRRLIALAALMTGGAVAMFSLTSAISMWFVLRLTAGLAITVVFVGVETWINQLAPHHARARILGLYAATLAGGFGAGAALFAFIGAEGDTGFWLGATFSALPALGMWAPAPRPSAPKAAAAGPSALLRIARASPIPIVAACAFGAIELASLNFLPVYGLRLGFGEGGAGVVLIALSLGSILLQTPIGWTADRVGRQRVLDICAIASVIAPIAVIVAGGSLAGGLYRRVSLWWSDGVTLRRWIGAVGPENSDAGTWPRRMRSLCSPTEWGLWYRRR